MSRRTPAPSRARERGPAARATWAPAILLPALSRWNPFERAFFGATRDARRELRDAAGVAARGRRVPVDANETGSRSPQRLAAARESVGIARATFAKWSADRAPVHGAALAYYALFSMAPLLLLVIAIAGLAFGQSAAQGHVVARIEGAVGASGAQVIEQLLASVSKPSTGIIATAVSLVTMLFGASGVLGQLQTSLQLFFEVPAREGPAWRTAVGQRAASFSMILVIGLLLLTSTVASALLAATMDVLAEHVPLVSAVAPSANFALSLALESTLFALLFKLLPRAPLRWSDAWLGGLVTALLFTAGKSALGLYLGRATTGSIYGAAGSLVMLLLWVYYSSQILFLGAEFTAVWAKRRDARERAGDAAG